LNILAMKVVEAQRKLIAAAGVIQQKNMEILRLTLLPGNDPIALAQRDAQIVDLRGQIALKDQEIGRLQVQLSNATGALGGSQLVSMTAQIGQLSSNLDATFVQIRQVDPVFNV
jgi:hypothetical protein